MYKITICLVVLKLHASSPQFPNHVDLQKVGEIIFNNEKYNILKPTAHVVTDYFKEYMQRRQNKQVPTKRVFIDDNGFRHFWNGFDDKIKSLRKTIVTIDDDTEVHNKNNDVTNKPDDSNENADDQETNDRPTNENENDVNSADDNDNQEMNDTLVENNVNAEIDDIPAANHDNDENNDAHIDNNDNTETNDATLQNVEITHVMETVTEKATPRRKTTTSHWSYYDPVKTVQKDGALEKDDKITEKEGDKKDNKAATKKPVARVQGTTAKSVGDTKNVKKDDTKTKERTVAKTTFFCPFFGVMTMSAFVD